MRPRSFEDLVNASLFAVLGFMSFSVFYSPQFVLWILPLVCFSGSRVMLIPAILFSWLTYLYFPISDQLRGARPDLFKAVVVAIGLLRLFMMFLAVRGRYSRSPGCGRHLDPREEGSDQKGTGHSGEECTLIKGSEFPRRRASQPALRPPAGLLRQILLQGNGPKRIIASS